MTYIEENIESQNSKSRLYGKGLFINYVIQSRGMGVNQKMTKDDGGGGGGLAKDDDDEAGGRREKTLTALQDILTMEM